MKVEDITDEQIEGAKKVLKNHVVNPLTIEGALESGLWCICSQGTHFEVASRFVYNLRDASSPGDVSSRFGYASLDVLTDSDRVNKAAEGIKWRFSYSKRFDKFIERFGRLHESNEGWPEEIIQDRGEMRRQYVREVKWLGNKTYSFWHICLGGTNLIALDVYVMRGLGMLGLDVRDDFFVPIGRSVSNQKVRKTPNTGEYLRIEQGARELFGSDKRFLDSEGKLDCALVDSVLWWEGAKRDIFEQGYLFGDHSGSWMHLPYAEIKPS